ncbi:hypothetical protein BGX26_005781 [Mortierella sp. AD094]|nr:hypothetical protein BGX26_005781 [Mortierella sp. AD094]
MPSNTHISLFQIPELVTMIAEYLTLYDIATLSITCKSLHQHLKPSLWKNFIIKKNEPEQMSLLENRQHIRTLHIKGLHESILDILASATQPSEPKNSIALDSSCIIDASTLIAMANLQKLTILPGTYERIYFRKASIILSQSPRLVQLRFPISWFVDYEDQFFNIMCNELPHLMEISASGDTINSETATRFLLACVQLPQLRTLEYNFGIEFDYYQDPSSNELLPSSTHAENEMKSSVISSPGSKITTIKINYSWYQCYQWYPASFLIRFLLSHCPYLERFEAHQIFIDYKGAREIYPGILFLNLQHIAFTDNDGTNKLFINFIIKECAKGTGLKSFQLSLQYYRNSFGGQILGYLTSNHSGTLEDVEISDSGIISIEGVRSLLKSSEGLKRLCIHRKVALLLDCNELVDFDWVCSNLKTLSLRVMFTSGSYIADGGVWTVPEKLFSHIGRLTKLETLALGWVDEDKDDILYPNRKKELVKRCLAQLANLSNLRQFQMLSSCWSPIDQDDVELIHNSWLPLRRVISREHEKLLTKQPHWQWLQEQRLSLQFSCTED